MTLKKLFRLIFIGAIITVGGVACSTNTSTETVTSIVETSTPTPTDTPVPTSTPTPVKEAKAPLPSPPPDDPNRKPNRLIHEKSPYLLQHANNPIDWYPWGEEAFEKARKENKLIFLSIGYSTCHWCHVMEEESFSDPDVGQLINDTFVAIKVDREERPDIDSYYMNVSTMLTGSGGWPLNIFMTPDQKPFLASTYIPKESRFGRPGLMELIPRMELAWQLQDTDLLNAANRVADTMEQVTNLSTAGEFAMDESLLEATYQQLADNFDAQNGGFGKAPKFATPHRLLFLLRYWHRTGDESALAMVEQTLQAIRQGGVYDQVGYGIHRYATDAEWLVPHFEKMLYDQALLALAYIETFQATGNPDYEQAAREIFTYVLRDMTAPHGGFYSAEDADSEGEEGKFYVWTVDEIQQALNEGDAAFAIAVFNLTDEGNFIDPLHDEQVGTNILHLTQPPPELAQKLEMSVEEFTAHLESVRAQLFAARETRIHPHKDDKILTDWNGLMIAALAKGGQVFGDPAYSDAAQQAADFILAQMSDENGRLLHRYRDGEAALTSNVDDYAFFTWGLLELYETTFEIRYLEAALTETNDLLNHFWDEENGGFYFTSDDGEDYLARQKQIYDGAIPSGNSVAMLNLLRLGRITANTEYEEKAVTIGEAFGQQIRQEPSAYSQLMTAVDFGVGPSYEVVIVGEPGAADTEAMITALQSEFVPDKVVLFRPAGKAPEITRLAEFTKYQSSLNNQATAYVCLNYYCELPTNDIEKMMELLAQK